MARENGSNGTVFSGASEIGQITGWTYNGEAAKVTSVAMKEAAVSNDAGILSESGTITVLSDHGDAGQALMLVGAEGMTLKLYYDGEASGDKYRQSSNTTIDSVAEGVENQQHGTTTYSWSADSAATTVETVA